MGHKVIESASEGTSTDLREKQDVLKKLACKKEGPLFLPNHLSSREGASDFSY